MSPGQFGPSHFGGEHPVDACAAGVLQRLPSIDFGDQPSMAVNAAIQALAALHTNFNLDHVEPTGVPGDVVEFNALSDSSSGWWRRSAQYSSRNLNAMAPY